MSKVLEVGVETTHCCWGVLFRVLLGRSASVAPEKKLPPRDPTEGGAPQTTATSKRTPRPPGASYPTHRCSKSFCRRTWRKGSAGGAAGGWSGEACDASAKAEGDKRWAARWRRQVAPVYLAPEGERQQMQAAPLRDVEATLALDWDHKVLTVITIYKVVAAPQQAQLLSILKATTGFLSMQPGFVGTALHRCLEGTGIVSYSQFADQGAYVRARAAPDVQQALAVLAQFVKELDWKELEIVFGDSRVGAPKIAVDGPPLVLLGEAHCAPGSQQALLEQSRGAMEVAMKNDESILSATLHRSLDGTMAISYVQTCARLSGGEAGSGGKAGGGGGGTESPEQLSLRGGRGASSATRWWRGLTSSCHPAPPPPPSPSTTSSPHTASPPRHLLPTTSTRTTRHTAAPAGPPPSPPHPACPPTRPPGAATTAGTRPPPSATKSYLPPATATAPPSPAVSTAKSGSGSQRFAEPEGMLGQCFQETSLKTGTVGDAPAASFFGNPAFQQSYYEVVYVKLG